MRRNQLLCISAVIFAGTLLISGCSGKKPAQAQPGGQAGPPGSVPADGAGIDTGSTLGDRPGEGNVDHTRFEAETVYFDFDSARVRPGELPKLQKVASEMRNSTARLVVEGYADERGTPEYNRALGERRALACREELIRLGLPASSISTASYGEEKPADSGHDEASWAKNRRCEFGVAGQ